MKHKENNDPKTTYGEQRGTNDERRKILKTSFDNIKINATVSFKSSIKRQKIKSKIPSADAVANVDRAFNKTVTPKEKEERK